MQELLDFTKIDQNYDMLTRGIQHAVQKSIQGTEEKLKISIMLEFEKFYNSFGMSLNDFCKYEETSAGGRKLKGRSDVLSGTLINEFKIYNWLSNEKNYKKAVKQIQEQYLEPLRENQNKYHGVICDGKTLVFLSYAGKKWIHNKRPLNKFSLQNWVLLISQKLKIPISSKNLIDSFSINTKLAIETIELLYDYLMTKQKTNQRVKMLFDEWQKSFSYIYGGILNEEKIKTDFAEISTAILTNKQNIKVDAFLFCFYTYYSLIVKLYASEIASIHLNIAPESPINALLNSINLHDALQDIENGKFYRDYAHIDNYIEGGFFSWYLDVWDDKIQKQVTSILKELNKFNFTTIYDTSNSRDILKNLYQEIIPKKIRHDLGEYYTPDWLIQSVLDDVGYTGNKINERILDPGCGSGGFLIEVINRIKSHKKNHSSEIISSLINNVVGFDVNPVAVLTARTNYLLAIAPLLKDNSLLISIPVYLADSIITPTIENQAPTNQNSYLISTVEGIFSLPRNFVDSGSLTIGMQIIDQCLESDYPKNDFIKLFEKEMPLSKIDMKEIGVFYEKIRKLHMQNKNRIWIKIIQNSFAPLLHTEFDYIVGNPPWIKWDFLSKEYKKRLGHLYLDIYKLFSHTGMKAGMGYAHDDVSVVFMYVATDKYLKQKGRLGFVMKQTLYKSVAGNEFRKFGIEKQNMKTNPLKVIKVNDMLKMWPFRMSAQAETSTLIIEKGSKTKYPVPYFMWLPKKGKIYESDDLLTVKKNTTIQCKNAYPHDPKNLKDVWILCDENNVPPKYSSTTNHYTPRHGIVNDLNAVFFVKILALENGLLRIRNNSTNRAKKKVQQVEKIIEKDLIYPFLKPRNIKKWHIDGYLYGLIPQEKNGENNESKLRIDYPKTYQYLAKFKSTLIQRSSKWFKMEGFPFYSIFGIGEYSFKPFKIVWSCMGYDPTFTVVSKTDDKFLGNKLIMPDNTIGSISVDNKQEAHFICSILNSKKIEKSLESLSSGSKWGISISMIKSIPIPKFDKADTNHIRLAELSIQAHHKNGVDVLDIENEINQLTNNIIQ